MSSSNTHIYFCHQTDCTNMTTELGSTCDACREDWRRCPDCGGWLRPDITWFEDGVDAGVFALAGRLVARGGLFVAVGTSGVVWPAAGFAQAARQAGARMVEINPEPNETSSLYDLQVRQPAGIAIPELFRLDPV